MTARRSSSRARIALRLGGLAVAAIAGIAGIAAIVETNGTAGDGGPREAPPLLVVEASGRAAAVGVPRARYHLTFEQRSRVMGQREVAIVVEGAWEVTTTAAGRAAVRFAAEALEGPAGELPAAMELQGERPVDLTIVQRDGVLAELGFRDGMSERAKRLLTGLATTLQLTERASSTWTATEEDLSGRYLATYVRSAEGAAAVIERGRRYVAGRDGEGLSAAAARGLTAREDSRFELDGEGVVSAVIALDLGFAVAEGAPPVELTVRASLQRLEVTQAREGDGAAAAMATAMATAPIEAHADFEAARRGADLALLDGATLAQLLDEARRAAAEPGRGAGAARAQALARLAAMVRIDPATAAAIGDALRAGGEPALLRLLAGALSSTRVAAGTDALAELFAAPLPEEVRAVVAAALSLSDPATEVSVAALRDGLDAPGGGASAQAALGLGTHRRKLAAAGGEEAAAVDGVLDGVLDELLARAARAESAAEQRLYLAALGNAGSTRALATLREGIARGDRNTASVAVFSLRFIGGPEADAALDEALRRPELAFAALRSIAYRDPRRWRGELAAVGERFAGHDGIQSELKAILRRWGNGDS
jgi:hypothetical protein